jgi:hypothetical protein
MCLFELSGMSGHPRKREHRESPVGTLLPFSHRYPDTPATSLSRAANGRRGTQNDAPPRGARTADADQISTSECPGLAVLAGSTLRLSDKRLGMKAISIDLPIAAGFVGVVTLKNRTLSPVARLFIEHAREVAKPLAKMKPLTGTRGSRRRQSNGTISAPGLGCAIKAQAVYSQPWPELRCLSRSGETREANHVISKPDLRARTGRRADGDDEWRTGGR